MQTKEEIEAVAEAVLAELETWQGFPTWWSGIDPEVQAEIREAIGRAAIDAVSESRKGADV